MESKEVKKLFTKSYIQRIRCARESNENKQNSGDTYFHPTKNRGIVEKTIDLRSTNPLCGVNSKPGGKQDWEERWFEAYLINKAKNNNWKLNLTGNEYRFLSSQLTFHKRSSLKVKGRYHTHVDLLLFDEDKECLVVLELKKRADEYSLRVAREELEVYVKEIKRLIETEKEEIMKAFDLKVVKDVIGYIVYPKSKPWKEFNEVKMTDRKLKVEFQLIPEQPQLHHWD